MAQKPLTLESFDYIRNNLNVNSNEIPMKFIEYWAVDDYDQIDILKYLSSEKLHHYDVFMFAYLTSMSQHVNDCVVTQEELDYYFFKFQTILGMRILNEVTDMKSGGTKIFDFMNYDKIEIIFGMQR